MVLASLCKVQLCIQVCRVPVTSGKVLVVPMLPCEMCMDPASLSKLRMVSVPSGKVCMALTPLYKV